MKTNLKLLALTSFMLCGTLVTACDNGETVTIWGPTEHEEVYKEAFKAFKEAHPEFTAKLKYSELGDAGANGNISKDVESAAEVYTFPNDQLIDLRSMGALGKLPDEKLAKVKQEQYPAAVEAAKFKENYYAYPISADNGFVFIYNKSAFEGTSVWAEDGSGLKPGYTFRDLFKALDEKEAEANSKWHDSVVIWPVGTAWYQCGIYFGAGSDYNVEFSDQGKQLSATCDFAYDADSLAEGAKPTIEDTKKKGFVAIQAMVNTYTNEDGTINKHFMYADDQTYNTIANSNSLPAEFTKEGGKPLAGIVCWNNGNLATNWGDDYECEVLPTLEASSKQYGTTYENDGVTPKRFTWKSFSGFKLIGVNPFSAYARKSQENLLMLHELAYYLSGSETSLARFENNGTGPSNLVVRESEAVKASKFMVKLGEQLSLVDDDGNNIGYRIQDCVPQQFWTPIATLGNGVFNYINDGSNAAAYGTEKGIFNQLYSMQKSITTTI